MKVKLDWQIVSGITSQLVQYKLATACSDCWIDFGYVDIAANSVTISDLSDNYIYNFRVQTSCSSGSPTPSILTSQINILCPTITTSVAASTISYSFSALGGSITGYTVKLYNSAGTTLLSTQTPSFTSSSTSITGTFSALTPSTAYKLELTIAADTFTKTCTQVSASTIAGTACDTPQSVTALIY